MIIKLLQRGANINASAHRNRWKTTLQAAYEWDTLSIEEQRRKIDLIYFLIEHGADINARPAEVGGRTALQYAVMHGDLEIVLLLLSQQVDVDAPSTEKPQRWSLGLAAEHGRLAKQHIISF